MSTEPSPAQTLIVDALGGIAIIWAIPLAIVLVGLPVALVVYLIRLAATWAS